LLLLKTNIAQALVKSNVIDEELLLRFIETKLHIPYVNLDDYTLMKKSLKYINAQDCPEISDYPLFAIEDVLTVQCQIRWICLS
jgi:hypothetical protein